MRIAAIDAGSNSIHLVVVEADPMGNHHVLAREKAMVRLARGEARSGEIGPESFQAGLEALGQMAKIIQGLGCDTIMACGTAALRDAKNAGTFLREAEKLGLPIRVISGEEEARLIFEAVRHAIPFPEGAVALLDIGGGSTEITWVDGGRVLASTSLPWGLQRLGDAVPCSDPPNAKDFQKLRRFIRRILKKARKELPRDLPALELVLGTSGTLEDLAKGAGGNGGFNLIQLQRFKKQLWQTDTAGRVRLGVDPKRAEVLHVGAEWAQSLMKWLGAPRLRHLPVGLREGMVWEALKHGGAAIPPLSERRRISVEALAARLDPDPGHSAHVAFLADRLFLELKPYFELGDREREWLSCAARVHDIGFSVSEKGHHKHGAYLVRNTKLQGFWPEEVELLANIVRHHRGKAPDPAKHEAFRAMAPWNQAVVVKLTAILQVADALDRRRRQSVRDLRLEVDGDRARLFIKGTGDLEPELDALVRKGALLARSLDRCLEIELET